ncbi:MAG: hypothetical protein JO113_06655 [Candidatus Eremiobacteraeota bacterium]|nr:hypothetical protein [Candidatus Eremiobacteraeota bacterium]
MTALCVALLLCAVSTPVQASVPTKIVIFAPWSSSGLRAGFSVASRAKGTCWSHSIATNRADAWRCMTGNDIYDPCFAGSPQKSVVACPEEPFSRNVVLLHDTKALDGRPSWLGHSVQPKGEPWALRLINGDTCVFETGATDVIGGKRMNYACVKSGWIVGFVNRSTKSWDAESVSSPSDKQLKKLGIASALF